MNGLQKTFGNESALELYKSTCPMVGATIGQHVRHSMDHMELAILLAQTYDTASTTAQLHYDLRVRGGTLEHDMEQAKQRVVDLTTMLDELASPRNDDDNTLQSPVQANFMLSGDGQEFGLKSTVGRELGFAAHHAIHHMAMIRLIAVHHVGMTDLPPDFGRAPSTVHNDGQTTTNS